MKTLTIILTLIGQFCIAQTFSIDSCGLNNDSTLNKYESVYFNKVFFQQRIDFNFNGKKIAFAGGFMGRTIISKKQYFEWYRDSSNLRHDTVYGSHTVLIIFNSEEKVKTRGYDAIILTDYRAYPIKKARERMIDRLFIKPQKSKR